MAQSFHHTILPLASEADRRTEIRWGIRDFEIRFGRRPTGLWLPETAVDLATLRILAEEGIAFTILAPWQAADPATDTRRLYQVALGGGRSIGIAFYDGGLSGAISFDPAATADADAFVRERLVPRFGLSPSPETGAATTAHTAARRDPTHDGADPIVVIATDGELYGHHQTFRDLFLQRLVGAGDGDSAGIPGEGHDRGFDVVMLSAAFEAARSAGTLAPTRIAERTSWSCHHGVARWSGECPDAADGRWKDPLRSSLVRLAAGIDAVTQATIRTEFPRLDLSAARDAYVDVVIGKSTCDGFAGGILGAGTTAAHRDRALDLLEAQRWRLAMFASDGWFWDDPIRPETKQVLRAAARAVRLVDGVAGTTLESRLRDDLTLFTSPARGMDGYAIYREALSEVNQPAG
jgi:hypothetical protein